MGERSKETCIGPGYSTCGRQGALSSKTKVHRSILTITRAPKYNHENECQDSKRLIGQHTCRLNECLHEYVHHTRSGRKNFVQGILRGNCSFCIISRIHQLLDVITSEFHTWTSNQSCKAWRRAVALAILVHISYSLTTKLMMAEGPGAWCGRPGGHEHLHRRCLFLRRRGRGAAMPHAHVGMLAVPVRLPDR